MATFVTIGLQIIVLHETFHFYPDFFSTITLKRKKKREDGLRVENP
jgi:hypothetical protein